MVALAQKDWKRLVAYSSGRAHGDGDVGRFALNHPSASTAPN